MRPRRGVRRGVLLVAALAFAVSTWAAVRNRDGYYDGYNYGNTGDGFGTCESYETGIPGTISKCRGVYDWQGEYRSWDVNCTASECVAHTYCGGGHTASCTGQVGAQADRAGVQCFDGGWSTLVYCP